MRKLLAITALLLLAACNDTTSPNVGPELSARLMPSGSIEGQDWTVSFESPTHQSVIRVCVYYVQRTDAGVATVAVYDGDLKLAEVEQPLLQGGPTHAACFTIDAPINDLRASYTGPSGVEGAWVIMEYIR